MDSKAIRSMKILLFGKNGQVGHELRRTLLPLGEVVALGRSDADLEDLAGLKKALHAHAPSIIVNATAYTAVDKAEGDEATATKINAEAVAVLAGYARDNNALLVHYSTDYVFDGEKAGAYVETDVTNPQSAYGRSKRAGEETIKQSGCNALVFRTSWVFSSHGGNFIKTMLRLAKERENLNVVADQFGAPTSAELIADVTSLAIAGYRKGLLSGGIYHLTAAGKTSWHGLACHVIERALANGAALKLESARIRAIPTEEYPVPAKRPKNSLMNTSALSTALGLQLPDWSIHVDRAVDQLTTAGKST
jgi:dTDP-4-dehydrorhamnose reductase